MANTVAGWYQDPQDPARVRWWDGRAWTEATSSMPPTPPPTTPLRAKRPLTRRAKTAGLVLAAGMAMTLVGGIAVGVTAEPAQNRPVSLVAGTDAGTDAGAESGVDGRSEASTTPTPRASTASTATVEVVTEVTAIPFTRTTVDDPAIDVGTSVVSTAGVDGAQSTSFRVMKRNGVETARVVQSRTITQQPVAEVTSVGTRQPPPPEPVAEPQPAPVAGGGGGCDPNYDWVCVPIASDVDCAGGSGNGPAYVQGPVHVIGRDIYDLDRDGDGIGCD